MSFLSKADYEETCCPFEKPNSVKPIPVNRVIEKLDAYLDRKDYTAAERHLKYWLLEADAQGDRRGKLTVLNEMIGLYRKTAQEEPCLAAIAEALALSDEKEFAGTVTVGTTALNAATGYMAFSQPEKASCLYRKAQRIYEAELKPDDSKLGGLYNNMALALTALGNYDEAEDLFHRAIEIMSQKEAGELDMAISYCNLADLVEARDGLDAGAPQLYDYLDKAEALLNTKTLPVNGYFAFVCEKCAPTFGYYGYFTTQKDLMRKAEAYYEGN